MGDNKTIVKNTIVIYIKVALSVFIGFYVSRQVLNALGASDYGLYNVVGGIVALMNLLGTTITSATCRYIAIEIGKPNGNVNRVFNTILVIHIGLAFFLLLIAETLGVYYINHFLNVGDGSLLDAHFVFQTSLVSSCFLVVCFPFQGLLIAKEKFVYTSVLEIFTLIVKLCLVILLVQYIGNKLRLYAIINSSITVLLYGGYAVYCFLKDKEVIRWNFNKVWADYIEIFKFTWWLLLGAVAVIGRVQGIALIINVFFGTIVNSAFALANTINEYVTTFVKSITQATTPQIMKSYGGGDSERSVSYLISKFSFLTMIIPVAPLLFNLDAVLRIWLFEPPQNTSLFSSLFVINGLIWTLSAGFDSCIQATGNIKENQIGYCIINLSILPVTYVLFKIGFPPYTNLVVMIILTLVTLLFQCYIMNKISVFNIFIYSRVVLLPAFITACVVFIPLYILSSIISVNVLVSLPISLVWTVVCVYVFGLSKHERELIILLVKERF